MARKNQLRELGALIWWVFRVIGIQKCQKNLFVIFVAFSSRHYGFMNCFEILNLVFSNVIPGGVWTCKILSFPNFGVFSLTGTFEEQFLLIRTRYSPEILRIIILFIVKTWQMFIKLRWVMSSKPQKLYHLVWNDRMTQEQFTLTCFGILKTLLCANSNTVL